MANTTNLGLDKLANNSKMKDFPDLFNGDLDTIDAAFGGEFGKNSQPSIKAKLDALAQHQQTFTSGALLSVINSLKNDGIKMPYSIQKNGSTSISDFPSGRETSEANIIVYGDIYRWTAELIPYSNSTTIYVRHGYASEWQGNWKPVYDNDQLSAQCTINTTNATTGLLYATRNGRMLLLNGAFQCASADQALNTVYATSPEGYRPNSSATGIAYGLNHTDKMFVIEWNPSGQIKKVASGTTGNVADWYQVLIIAFRDY